MSDFLRVQVAACTRALVAQGILGYSGHVSALLPDGDSFLIQPFSVPRAELTPDQLLVCDLSGRVLTGTERPPDELFIHSESYRARPDVRAVAHFHHHPSTLLTMVSDVSISPMTNHASRWASGVPTYPSPAHVATPEEGQELARVLGSAHAAQLRAHGQLVVAEDVPALLTDAIHFVENTWTMQQALMLGTPVPLAPDEVERFLSTFSRPRHAEKLWAYYLGETARAGYLPSQWLDTLLAPTGDGEALPN